MDPLVHAVLSAAEQGHKQRLATLLRENPEMAEACDEEGSTPLMYAAANGRENVLHLLVQVKAGTNNFAAVLRHLCMTNESRL